MKEYKWNWIIVLFIGLFGALSTGCGPDAEQPKDLLSPPLPSKTPIIIQPVTTIEANAPAKDSEITLEVTQLPVEVEVEELTSDDDPPLLEDKTDALEPIYRVHFIEDDDVLNIRSGPGVAFPIVGEHKLATAGIRVTGQGQLVDDSLWLPTEHDETNGWINSRYLVEQSNTEEFCADGDSKHIVEKLLRAIESEDGDLLAELVEEGRSLRIRRHWWNPEVNLDSDVVPEIFISTESHRWGVTDGSGEAIVGTFSVVIDPLLRQNLLGATEIGCGIILHGGTAGFVKLPIAYEGINFYSLYRPAGPDEFELDWGTWVVGIETWQDDYRLAFLVHYEWEI